MTAIFELYICLGSMPTQADIREVINVIGDQHAQFHVIGLMQGFWKGIPEDTLVVQVSDDQVAVRQTAEMLKVLLEHDAISIVDLKKKFK